MDENNDKSFKPMNKFYQKVDRRSRKAMVAFLTGHFRYDTMNSWNRSTSWANNMKVHRCIPSEYLDKVFEMMEAEGFYDEINELIRNYDLENDYCIQAGFNGRSGGYLVMYEGGYDLTVIFSFDNGKDRDYADCYGWLSLDEAKNSGLYKKTVKKIKTYSGRSVDDYSQEDYEEMSMWELRQIVEKVQNFDTLCDNIVATVINMAENCEVEEEEYIVTKTRKVLV